MIKKQWNSPASYWTWQPFSCVQVNWEALASMRWFREMLTTFLELHSLILVLLSITFNVSWLILSVQMGLTGSYPSLVQIPEGLLNSWVSFLVETTCLGSLSADCSNLYSVHWAFADSVNLSDCLWANLSKALFRESTLLFTNVKCSKMKITAFTLNKHRLATRCNIDSFIDHLSWSSLSENIFTVEKVVI